MKFDVENLLIHFAKKPVDNRAFVIQGRIIEVDIDFGNLSQPYIIFKEVLKNVPFGTILLIEKIKVLLAHFIGQNLSSCYFFISIIFCFDSDFDVFFHYLHFLQIVRQILGFVLGNEDSHSHRQHEISSNLICDIVSFHSVQIIFKIYFLILTFCYR